MAKRHYLPITADVPGVNEGQRAFIRKVIRTALAAEGDPKRLRVQRLLHYGLPVLVCLVLAVVWVCTRNMPLWPDKAAMLLMLGALGIGYGFRGWYLYYNDRDQ